MVEFKANFSFRQDSDVRRLPVEIDLLSNVLSNVHLAKEPAACPLSQGKRSQYTEILS